MKVSDVMTRSVRTVLPTDSMGDALRIMWEGDCGCVPVVAPDGRVHGMLTDRDVGMAVLAHGLAPDALPVGEAMSAGAHVCGPDDDLQAALATMGKRQVHRLPVVDDQGRLEGLLSLTDVVQAVQDREPAERRHFADTLLGVLAHVTRPRRAPVEGPEPVAGLA